MSPWRLTRIMLSSVTPTSPSSMVCNSSSLTMRFNVLPDISIKCMALSLPGKFTRLHLNLRHLSLVKSPRPRGRTICAAANFNSPDRLAETEQFRPAPTARPAPSGIQPQVGPAIRRPGPCRAVFRALSNSLRRNLRRWQNIDRTKSWKKARSGIRCRSVVVQRDLDEGRRDLRPRPEDRRRQGRARSPRGTGSESRWPGPRSPWRPAGPRSARPPPSGS